MNIIKIQKKWGHCACLGISRLLKWGIFTGCVLKVPILLYTELNLGYLKGTKFWLESKASFTDISSIASFKLFLIAWLRHYFPFSDSSVVNLSPRVGQNTPSWELFSKTKSCSTIKLFSSSNIFFITLFLANT